MQYSAFAQWLTYSFNTWWGNTESKIIQYFVPNMVHAQCCMCPVSHSESGQPSAGLRGWRYQRRTWGSLWMLCYQRGRQADLFFFFVFLWPGADVTINICGPVHNLCQQTIRQRRCHGSHLYNSRELFCTFHYMFNIYSHFNSGGGKKIPILFKYYFID